MPRVEYLTNYCFCVFVGFQAVYSYSAVGNNYRKPFLKIVVNDSPPEYFIGSRWESFSTLKLYRVHLYNRTVKAVIPASCIANCFIFHWGYKVLLGFISYFIWTNIQIGSLSPNLHTFSEFLLIWKIQNCPERNQL